eukprot:TRINITY_DN7557_c0_g1_i1.p2 TRINITY_DN7557_c0_g1~~TRINITY_DN7557_c0_g1_i1.p2  ORF type:complete len:136 (-),score=25.48 TRINITY_DN7557_c0_g1_i1:56-463(-)
MEQVDLSGILGITDDGLYFLSPCTQLTFLELCGTGIERSTSIIHVAERCPISFLGLAAMRFLSGKDLVDITRRLERSLVKMNICWIRTINFEDMLMIIRQCPFLGRLWITGCRGIDSVRLKEWVSKNRKELHLVV